MAKVFVTLLLFLFMFIAFFALIGLGLTGYVYSSINDALDVNISIGQTNLQTVNSMTFGKIATQFIDKLDTLGLALLLGMCLFMIAAGYFIGENNKLWIVLDIFIIFAAFISAIYVSSTYEIFIGVDEVGDFIVDELPRSSIFMLHLPTIVVTLGAFIMIVTYSLRRRNLETNQEVIPLGY